MAEQDKIDEVEAYLQSLGAPAGSLKGWTATSRARPNSTHVDYYYHPPSGSNLKSRYRSRKEIARALGHLNDGGPTGGSGGGSSSTREVVHHKDEGPGFFGAYLTFGPQTETQEEFRESDTRNWAPIGALLFELNRLATDASLSNKCSVSLDLSSKDTRKSARNWVHEVVVTSVADDKCSFKLKSGESIAVPRSELRDRVVVSSK